MFLLVIKRKCFIHRRKISFLQMSRIQSNITLTGNAHHSENLNQLSTGWAAKQEKERLCFWCLERQRICRRWSCRKVFLKFTESYFQYKPFFTATSNNLLLYHKYTMLKCEWILSDVLFSREWVWCLLYVGRDASKLAGLREICGMGGSDFPYHRSWARITSIFVISHKWVIFASTF